jgi:hypothetical protein
MGNSLFIWRLGALWLLLAGLVLAQGATAQAQETHLFDPTLSLTGSCTVTAVDTIPDPGPCPGVAGVDHPKNPFAVPIAVTTDSHGNIFVANTGSKGLIDVFDSAGFFITEVAAPQASEVAVDSKGNLYVIREEGELVLYEPTLYEPVSGEIAYNNSPKTISGKSAFYSFIALEIDLLNNHLFAFRGDAITEYGSAEEGNNVIETFGEATFHAPSGRGMAIDFTRGRIYASDVIQTGPEITYVVRVFELGAPHKLLETIDGSTTPAGEFLSPPSLAVEELTGNLFTYDVFGSQVVYELSEDGEYLATIDHEMKGHFVNGAQIAVDNGSKSPNGAENTFGHYLYVPAYTSNPGHSFAFGPVEECPPEVESTSVAGVGEEEAKLQAGVNPCNLQTTYTLEYTTQKSFEEEGFAGATIAGEGQLPATFSPEEVSSLLTGLEAGTTYRFRVFVENEKGEDEKEGEFTTYPAAEGQEPCPNEALRTGLSALLPDCRAYELVSPPDTNARSPLGVGWLGTYFLTREASPAGGAVSFELEGGSFSGNEGTGSFASDPYLSTRTEAGWGTSYVGPTALEAPGLLPGSNSPDQGFSLWSTAGGEGSAAVEGKSTTYVRYPDGHSALVGRGSLGTDPRAVGKLISENGSHIVFVSGGNDSAIQLEPDAPPSGTTTIYDRTADEVTHVVSLLPGDVTPAAGEDAAYQGASLDGKGIAFSIGKTLYFRYNDEETYEIGESVTFAGVAEGGGRIFYLEGGNLFAFDVASEEALPFSSSGDVTLVNVAGGGHVAYFVSPSSLTSEANPNGAKPVSKAENLYRSEEGLISFVGTVTERDVEGENPGNEVVDGLGLWISVVGPGRLGADPSRATPEGNVLLFESRANLAGYDPEGHAEVYRYDVADNELDCLSCIPTLAPATGHASLQSVKQNQLDLEPFSSYALVANLSTDGQRAFFQSTEALVPGDSDKLQDVYQWEAQGVGSCKRQGGCIDLISSGQSLRIDYLYAVSDSGDDVFFRSSDLLLSADIDETPSIYDARVEGGFADEEATICQGEGCRPTLTPPPGLPTPGMAPDQESGNSKPPKHCPKGKHKVTKNGKTRCVKKRPHKRKHHRSGAKKKGAGK